MVVPLNAMPKTQLWDRLEREGRLQTAAPRGAEAPPQKLHMALHCALLGAHFVRSTRDDVLPKLERTLTALATSPNMDAWR
ncbi:MAG: hypothetical protein ACYCW6_18520 [Candidatus Xenobia bacterium]